MFAKAIKSRLLNVEMFPIFGLLFDEFFSGCCEGGREGSEKSGKENSKRTRNYSEKSINQVFSLILQNAESRAFEKSNVDGKSLSTTFFEIILTLALGTIEL